MKKKIIAFSLVIAMVAVAAVSATLAYFTSQDKVVNTFTIGNVDIDLYEYTDIDGDGVLEEQKFQQYLNYSNIMPSDALPKVPYVENTGDNAAYVRVAVVMNNVSVINNAIDTVYEKKGYTDDQIQTVYDEVFDGWGVSYIKRSVNGANDRRLWMNERTSDSKVLFGGQIDMYCNQGSYGMFDVKNTFKADSETDEEGFDYACNGYYRNATENDERVYVFYLKLEKGEKYKLFAGLNAPAEFTNEQMQMFQNLKIAIYADAIQVDGFTSETEAFNALEQANPLGWWK